MIAGEVQLAQADAQEAREPALVTRHPRGLVVEPAGPVAAQRPCPLRSAFLHAIGWMLVAGAPVPARPGAAAVAL